MGIPTTPLLINETQFKDFTIQCKFYTNDAVIIRNLKTGYKEFQPGFNQNLYCYTVMGIQFSVVSKSYPNTQKEISLATADMTPEQKKAFDIGLNFIENEKNNPQKPTFVVSQVV